MKKTTVSALAATALLCYCFWLLITGQIVLLFTGGASAQVLIAGAVVSIAAACFSARFFIHEKAFFLLHPRRFFTLVLYCLVIFPIELIKANIDMAARALGPKGRTNPGIVKIPVDLKSEYAQSMLANSITLTPGTITMDIVEEDGQIWYYVHWINVTEDDPVKAGEAIKGTMEKWIRRIWES